MAAQLQIVFCTATERFQSQAHIFNFNANAVADDVFHIIGTYFTYDIGHEFKLPSKPTRINQQKLICQQFNFRRYDRHVSTELKVVARRVVRRSAKPIYILRELLSFLEKQQVVSPAYSTFQDMIGNCLSEEHQRIGQQFMRDLDPDIEAALSAKHRDSQ